MHRMKNKKLLILGMGPSQFDLALVAKENGMNVYAVGRDVYEPMKEYLDDYAFIDILDIDGIVAYAEEKQVDVVFSAALELSLLPIAQVSKRLGLNTFFTEESLSLFDDKGVWREQLGDITGNLEFQVGKTAEDFLEWSIYPAILKPVDGSGQRGVVRINNYDELKAKIERSKSFSKLGSVIVERFAEGEEISVNSIMENGELRFAMVSDRLSHEDLPGGLIKEHHVPSKYDHGELREKFLQVVENVNKKMGFTDGHIYFQMKVSGDDVALIEFTPRFDGCHLWKLIETATGLNLLQVALEQLIYGSSKSLDSYEEVDLTGKKYVLEFASAKPETEFQHGDYTIPNNATHKFFYYEDGEQVKRVTGILEKAGYFIYEVN